MKVKDFSPDRDVPDLAGRVMFVTGGTDGLGAETIRTLAKHGPAHIYFSGRSDSKATALIQSVKATTPGLDMTFLKCDHTSLDSVKSAVSHFTSPRLDILICNAGIMATPPQLTTDGYEVQFGTNHLGHALLIKLLLPTLLSTASRPGADARIVLLTSLGFKGAPSNGIDFSTLRTTQDSLGGVPGASAWFRYGQSKLANLLYAAELARRYPSVTSVAVHPGVIVTGLVNNLGFWNKLLVYATTFRSQVTLAEGVYNQVWAATCGKGRIVNGAYYEPVAELGQLTANGKREDLARELWEWTEKELERF